MEGKCETLRCPHNKHPALLDAVKLYERQFAVPHITTDTVISAGTLQLTMSSAETL